MNNQNCFYTALWVKIVSLVNQMFHYRLIWKQNIIYAFKSYFQEKTVFEERVKTECVTVVVVNNSVEGWKYADIFYGKMNLFLF